MLRAVEWAYHALDALPHVRATGELFEDRRLAVGRRVGPLPARLVEPQPPPIRLGISEAAVRKLLNPDIVPTSTRVESRFRCILRISRCQEEGDVESDVLHAHVRRHRGN